MSGNSGQQQRGPGSSRVAPPLYRKVYNKIRFGSARRFWETVTAYDIFRAGARGPRRPDFVIIGAPKCGTSWLRVALAEHPEIIMVRKEIEYFSHHLDSRLAWYADHFAERSPLLDERNAAYRRPYGECLIGEKSASYSNLSRRRIRMAHRFMPEARLILVIRDPIERHWAHAKQYFFKKWRINATEIPEQELYAFFLRTRRHGEYARIIEEWGEVFGPERLLVLFQEQLRADPEQALDQTLDHIGVSKGHSREHMRYLFKQVNPGPKIPIEPGPAAFLADMFASEYARLRALLGDRMDLWPGSDPDQTRQAS